MDDSSDNGNQAWLQDGINSMQLKRSEMNELIMDYLVHEGFKEAAERFREEAGIEPTELRLSDAGSSDYEIIGSETSGDDFTGNHTNNDSNNTNNNNNNNSNTNNSINNRIETIIAPSTEAIGSGNLKDEDKLGGLKKWPSRIETPDMMDKRIEIRHSIEEGDILKSISLINLYHPELLDTHKNLHFKLQQQHLIEMIRHQKINDVLSYVHDQLSVDELLDLGEMERTLALLAYENPDKSPYADLLHISHRLQLASEMNDIILQEITGDVEPTKPRLVTLLKLLFWTQSELERKKIQFPKMTDLVNGTIIEPRH